MGAPASYTFLQRALLPVRITARGTLVRALCSPRSKPRVTATFQLATCHQRSDTSTASRPNYTRTHPHHEPPEADTASQLSDINHIPHASVSTRSRRTRPLAGFWMLELRRGASYAKSAKLGGVETLQPSAAPHDMACQSARVRPSAHRSHQFAGHRLALPLPSATQLRSRADSDSRHVHGSTASVRTSRSGGRRTRSACGYHLRSLTDDVEFHQRHTGRCAFARDQHRVDAGRERDEQNGVGTASGEREAAHR